MKKIVIVPDGAADYPISDLNGQTPLEYAQTPFMDDCALKGRVGRVQHIPDGLPSGSDVGNLSLLGYNVQNNYPGRAPFEAASLDVPQTQKDLVYRCNLVSVSQDKMIDFSAGHITTEESIQLIHALQSTLGSKGIQFFPGLGYRHILLVSSNETSRCQGILTPPHDLMGKSYQKDLLNLNKNSLIAEIISLSKDILESHEVNFKRTEKGQLAANMIWLWGQGYKPVFDSFETLYGHRGGMISAVDLLKGIAVALKMEIINVPGITGYFDTDYSAKMSYALSYLKDHESIFIHVESPDEAGHAGLFDEKVKALEKIDSEIVGPLVTHFETQKIPFRILISPDHPTPVSLKTHTHDLVPFCVYGEGVRKNELTCYSERESRRKEADEYLDGSVLMRNFFKGEMID